MANITEAEKIAHYWARQTATAISWTGGLSFFVGLATLVFTVWTHFAKNDEEEARRRRADAQDRERRRRNDTMDRERREREDEEEKKRREEKAEEERRWKKEKEEEKARREKAGREAEERWDQAEKRLEGLIQTFRCVCFIGESFQSRPALQLSRGAI